jgi:zinc and cadmium transporter
MLDIYLYSIVSVLVVSLLSLVGVFALAVRIDRLKKFLLYAVSFSAGALLGDVFIHILPEVSNEFGFGIDTSVFILVGIVTMFVVEKIIRWRHCHEPECSSHKKNVKPFALMNLFGDGVHNFIDGLIIGVSYLVSIPLGLATTLAVVFHEIPQEIGDFGVLVHGGFSRGKALLFNLLTALVALAGVVVGVMVGNIASFVLPFAAGSFIYIAGVDLMPELHKERGLKNSLGQLFFFLLGIGIMLLLVLLG